MTIINEKINSAATKIRIVLLSLFFGMFVLAFWMFTNSTIELEENPAWQVQFATKEYPIRTDQSTVIQVIIMDEENNWIEEADVSGEFEMEDVISEINLTHVEDGLYEGRIHFTKSGYWNGTVIVEHENYWNEEKIQIRVLNS